MRGVCCADRGLTNWQQSAFNQHGTNSSAAQLQVIKTATSANRNTNTTTQQHTHEGRQQPHQLATVGKRHKKAKRETIFSAATGYTRKRADATPRHAKQIDQRRARAESSTYEAGRQAGQHRSGVRARMGCAQSNFTPQVKMQLSAATERL